MLNKFNVKDVIPKYDKVLVQVSRLPKVTASGIYVGETNQFSSGRLDIDNYSGKIVSMGKSKKIQEISPGLKVGDNVLFSQYAGYHIPSSGKNLAKLLSPGDIHCKVQDDMKLELENAKPVGERLLLEIIQEDEVTESGIIVSQQESDPRNLDSEKCRVIEIGDSVEDDYKKGDIVYIPQYVGNTIILDDGMMVKTVNYNDVLFVLK